MEYRLGDITVPYPMLDRNDGCSNIVIGGDLGDVHIDYAYVNEGDYSLTDLVGVRIVSSLTGFTSSELEDLVIDIIGVAFSSIGEDVFS